METRMKVAMVKNSHQKGEHRIYSFKLVLYLNLIKTIKLCNVLYLNLIKTYIS